MDAPRARKMTFSFAADEEEDISLQNRFQSDFQARPAGSLEANIRAPLPH